MLILVMMCSIIGFLMINSVPVQAAKVLSKKNKVQIVTCKSTEPGRAVIKYKKVRNAKKYQIVIAENKKFTKNKRVYYTKKTKKIITGLISGKRYYIKVRAYKLYGKASGKWSTIKTFKVKQNMGVKQNPEIQSPPTTEQNVFSIDEKELVIPNIKKEYRIVVLNDLHIIQIDDSISQNKTDEVKERYESFCDLYGNHSSDLWTRLIEKVNGMNPDCVILSGDMIDYFSIANFNYLKNGIDKIKAPVMYLRADHDLSLYYTNSITKEIRDKEELQIDSNENILTLEFDDFVIMGFNNSTSNLEEGALDKVEEIWDKKKPVILATHVPLKSQINNGLFEKSKNVWQNRALIWGKGCSYSPNEVTQKFFDIIMEENSPVVATVGGHLHFPYEDKLNNNIIQWVFDASFKGNIGCITIKK